MKNWLITIAVVLCFTAIAAIFVFAHYSRSIDVGSKTIAGTAAATSSAMGAAPSSTLAIATTTEFSAASYTSTIPTPPDFTVNISSTFAFPTSPIDTTVYDAKMLAIANLPAPYTIKTTITTTTLSSTGTPRTVTTTFMKTIQPATGWPVKNAPYPIPGAILPYDRIVAYYGNLYSTQMGVLGEYPAPQMLAMLASTTAMWQAADTSTPVVPAPAQVIQAARLVALRKLYEKRGLNKEDTNPWLKKAKDALKDLRDWALAKPEVAAPNSQSISEGGPRVSRDSLHGL